MFPQMLPQMKPISTFPVKWIVRTTAIGAPAIRTSFKNLPCIHSRWPFGLAFVRLVWLIHSSLKALLITSRTSRFWKSSTERQLFERWSKVTGSCKTGRPRIAARKFKHLKKKFENRLVALGTEFAWPPYSPDLNPYDFFLWGFLKDNEFENDDPDLPTLKEKIVRACKDVTPEILANVFQSFVNRLKLAQSKSGHHFQQFL